MKAKKKFGQNFLIDNFYINSIIEAIDVFSTDLIIEIGPGHGALTKRLKEKGKKLIAYEVDVDLKPILNKYEDEKTEIIYQDFLTADLSIYKKAKNITIVGNLPYYITTPIIEHIIKEEINPKEMIMMVQKEVADRFLAEVHTKEYGYFTLFLRYFFDITRVINVPSSAFNPMPKVESTVIKLQRRENRPDIDIKQYEEVLKSSFSQKRKQLKNNLSGYDWDKVKKILASYNINEKARAEEIPEEVFIEIAKVINKDSL